ncbi:MAG: 2-amino-4-hydroxy-6-hydroxymethyldihydropteridine diphosphokinase [Gammaproteobacteria bacterium]|jgi:2-amino-4-hydroxy-6-hydroxymethyldihydropteridine diphosphokinase|nr:2-amino-4-hydroxy-6-hydroxymethyldihydropteridine diphosphokinase [Gammaproteobacteria bacterium]
MDGTRCYIGLGSNLDNPARQVATAIEALTQLPNTTVIRVSSLYRSPPMGPQDQPDYINAVAALDTRLSPESLLQQLLSIEQRHGRVRGSQRWTARPLDLDILVYGEIEIDTQALTIPHPGIAERNFVLYPLLEIAPGLVIPQLGSISSLIAGCEPGDLVKLHDEWRELKV